MNRIKNSLIAFGGLSLLIGAIAFATPRPTQGQGGDPVGLTRPVQVVNTVLVSDAPRQPFNQVGQMSFSDGQFIARVDIFTVPTGKQLVVTSASAATAPPLGQRVAFRVNVLDAFGDAFIAIHDLPPVASGPLVQGGPNSFVASEPLRLYVNAGEVLSGFALRDASAGFAFGRVSVSGYLVDVP